MKYSASDSVFEPGIQIFTAQKHYLKHMSLKEYLDHSMSTGTRVYKVGQVLFTEGEPSTSLFIIRRGAVSVRKMKGASIS